MYDLEPPDRGIAGTFCLNTFYNDLSPSVGNIPSLEFLKFTIGICITLKIRKPEPIFQVILLFFLMLYRLPYFLAYWNRVENVHSYYSPCIETFSVQKLLNS